MPEPGNPYAVLSEKLGPAGALRVSTWLANQIVLAKEKQGELFDITPRVYHWGMKVWLEVNGCYETDSLDCWPSPFDHHTLDVTDRKLFQDCIVRILYDMSDGWVVKAPGRFS